MSIMMFFVANVTAANSNFIDVREVKVGQDAVKGVPASRVLSNVVEEGSKEVKLLKQSEQ